MCYYFVLFKGSIGERSYGGKSVSRITGTRKKRSRIGGQTCSRIKWSSRGFTTAYTKVKSYLLINIIGININDISELLKLSIIISFNCNSVY